jgi:prolipoprotein diacylglyceryltransferase
VYYTHEDTLGQSIPVHPATSYELLGDLIIFAIAVWLATRYIGRLYVFWTVLAGYAAMRFGLQFLRIDQELRFLDLQQSQIISLLVLLTFGLWLTNCLRTRLWHQKPKA